MGWSMSRSESRTDQTSQQITTTGATAEKSPTLAAGGNITYTPPNEDVALGALVGMRDVVQKALELQGAQTAKSIDTLATLSSAEAAGSARAADNSASLLQAILASNATLAEHTSTGGADMAVKTSNYLIWGIIGLAAVALGVFGFRKSRA